jgi:hypothetical protein
MVPVSLYSWRGDDLAFELAMYKVVQVESKFLILALTFKDVSYMTIAD